MSEIRVRDVEPGTRQQAARDRGALADVERIERIALRDGHLGGEVDVARAHALDMRAEHRRGEPEPSMVGGHAIARMSDRGALSAGREKTTPTTPDPTTAAVTRAPSARHERSEEISLLSPEYLLSVERRPFHPGPPDH